MASWTLDGCALACIITTLLEQDHRMPMLEHGFKNASTTLTTILQRLMESLHSTVAAPYLDVFASYTYFDGATEPT